ncbi:MAG TPA: L-threonine 3-dehydrogenase [Ktedonobacteraceae bacterium]|jgi:threonine 3-dehydrogenase|nr:L-threonine 3-dehydrogenase [Ktedonobacteraceae bacterium]
MEGTMMAALKAEAAPGATVALVNIPRIGPRDVLVKVKAASICGTDMHIYEWDVWAQSRMTTPRIFGHEFAGEIVEVGDEVTQLVPGDFVAAETHITCGHCYQCRTGQAHVCQNVQIIGVDRDGAFAQYIAIPESVAWKTGKEIDHSVASIQEPFGNAVHATFAGEIADMTVAVIGCGPIGLWAVGLSRISGSSTIFAIEPNSKRLEIATKMGADYVINPREVDPVQKVLDVTGGLGVDVVLEMSGNPLAIRQGFKMLRSGGRVSLLGIPSRMVELDLANDIIFKGATVLGISGRRIFDSWYRTRRILEGGQLDLKQVITHTLPFEQIHEAMEIMKSGDCGKIVLTFD